MGDVNTDVLILVGGLIVLVLLGAGFFLLTVFDKPRKAQKERLDRIKARHKDGVTLASVAGRGTIRRGNQRTGFDQILANIMPKPELFQARLDKTGKKITIGQYFTASGILVVLITALMIVVTTEIVFSVFLGAALGLAIPHFLIGRMGKKRIELFIKQFPEAIDLMVRGLKAGLPINETLISIGQEIAEPTGLEFKRITDEIKFGKTMEDAMWDTAERLSTQEFKFFVITLVVQRETGGNLGETLGNLSTILRQRQAMKLKVRALSGEARASAMILGSLPFVMLAAIMTLNYDYGIVLFTDPDAKMIGLVGLVWMSIGIFIMAQMINFEI